MKGPPILYTSFNTTLGKIFIAATQRGICDLAISTDRVLFLKRLRLKYAYPVIKDDRPFHILKKGFEDYLSGMHVRFNTPIDVKGTDFEKRVWKEVRNIPYGETRTYGEIARRIGNPKATRAVGQACGKNPIPIIIPCHRVVATIGLGGYSSGLRIKERLLKMESGLPGRPGLR